MLSHNMNYNSDKYKEMFVFILINIYQYTLFMHKFCNKYNTIKINKIYTHKNITNK